MSELHPLYFDRSAEYAAHRPVYPPELVDFLAGLAPRDEVAWDAGCGSGQLSVPLAARFARVIATDASEAQIAAARPHPGVEYRVAAAEASGLPEASVDLAVSAQAAHWFDLEAYYAEVRRVARPGGVLALVSYGIVRAGEAVDRFVERFHRETLAPWWPPERRHVDEGYRSLPFPFDEIEAPALEIRAGWSLADFLGYVETWSGVRRLVEAEGRGPLDALRRDLERAWGPEPVRLLRWPLALRVARIGRTPRGVERTTRRG